MKTVQAIPDNERWLHEPSVASALDRAIKWAEQNPPQETQLTKLETKLKATFKAQARRGT